MGKNSLFDPICAILIKMLTYINMLTFLKNDGNSVSNICLLCVYKYASTSGEDTLFC